MGGEIYVVSKIPILSPEVARGENFSPYRSEFWVASEG